jgi:TolA-binding protein
MERQDRIKTALNGLMAPAARYVCGVLSLIVLALGIFVGTALAGPEVTIEPDRQFALAQSLFEEKDFSGAVIEFRRFVHFFPADARVAMAMYRIGRSYYNDAHFQKAIAAFYDLLERFPAGSWTVRAYQGIAASHLENNAPGQAVAVLERLIAASPDPDVVDNANYRIGWIYLDQGDWNRARTYFNRIRPESRTAYRVGQLSDRLDRVADIPRKDPAAAGLLAILPGAGHFYCGRYKDAFIALAVNAALIAAAIESFDNDLPVLGGVIAAVGLGFYAGNIYSAVGSAHKYNRREERKFIEDLKREARPALLIGASPKGIAAALRFPF